MAERIKAIRQKMKEEETKSIPIPTENKGKILKMFLAVAAASALFFFCWQFIATEKNTPEQLFAQSYEPYAASISTRGLTSEKSLIQANSYYNGQNYQAAIPPLKTALSNHPNNSDLELALGNSYLFSNQIDLAITHFQNIIQRKDPLYTDQANWYLALSYLKNDQPEKCKNILQLLAGDSKADFHQEAAELLKKL